MAKEHFQRRTNLNASENRSLFAVPVVKLGPEMSAPGEPLPSEVQQSPNRGVDPIAQFRAAGYMVIGAGDDITFAEPSGGAYALVDGQLDKLVDEMHRVSHQMAQSVANTTSALGRSGLSKTEDRHPTETVLTALGAFVRELTTAVYDLIAKARGEDVVWQVHGLDSFETVDRPETLQEAMQVGALSIPSQTFRRLYKTQLAYKLLGSVSPEVAKTIEAEITEGVTTEDELSLAQHEQQIAVAKMPIEPQQSPSVAE
jgi:hypothetical protein